MVERRFGRIVNVASLAGLVPGSPGGGLYSAIKAFVVSFSQTLHIELANTGVHVSALCPGFTYSEFHDVNNAREMVSQIPAWLWMGADERWPPAATRRPRPIARCVCQALPTKPSPPWAISCRTSGRWP